MMRLSQVRLIRADTRLENFLSYHFLLSHQIDIKTQAETCLVALMLSTAGMKNREVLFVKVDRLSREIDYPKK